MEIGDASDHRGARDQLVAVRGELGQKFGVLGVSLDEVVARVAVEAALDRPVLAEVVDADNFVPRLQQVGNEIAANETRGSGDKDLQSRMGPVMPQMSTTSRPSSSSAL